MRAIALGTCCGLAVVAFPPIATASPPEAAAQPVISDQAPLSPEQAREQVFVPEGFSLELAAAEPQVLDPVALDWDAAGRLWVVEMADYPLGMDDKGRPGGRIRVLEDTDADGRYEKATLFADGLNFPNGCLTWRDGVIVTAAPEILFLADTDGDGRADRREVLVSGLAEGNQQLRPNGLRWGLDNWVYVASGSPGGWFDSTLVSTRSGTKLAVGSRDFRFRPDSSAATATTGAAGSARRTRSRSGITCWPPATRRETHSWPWARSRSRCCRPTSPCIRPSRRKSGITTSIRPATTRVPAAA
jgi:hypothetical protein